MRREDERASPWMGGAMSDQAQAELTVAMALRRLMEPKAVPWGEASGDEQARWLKSARAAIWAAQEPVTRCASCGRVFGATEVQYCRRGDGTDECGPCHYAGMTV